MRFSVNTQIAITHIVSRRKQTLVAALGVTVGITAFVFLNSLVLGFNRFFDNTVFKSMPHLRIFHDDEVSQPLLDPATHVVVNPRILNKGKNLINPDAVLKAVQSHSQVVAAVQWVTVNLFYTSGKSQVAGQGCGADIIQVDKMFDIRSTVVAGDMQNLKRMPNGVLLGSGVAEKLNLQVNDNITVISSLGVSKSMKIAGIFRTGNSITDKTRCYMNLSAAQTLLREGNAFVTDIYVKIKDVDHIERYDADFESLTGYTAENWKEANETYVAGAKTRAIMMRAISAAILLVAAFGIYNILNMTIMQKLNDIAILKAQGFSGKDVIKIFVTEALLMGLVGTIMGLLLATFLIRLMSRVYIGGDIGYFPIGFEPVVFVLGAIVGLLVTVGAGYIPARNAAKVDPVEIFRR